MSRFFDDKVLSDDQICEETCENGQVSPESRYNDYRNRLPFHYIEDGENDGYYYWTYGATMELSIILSDDVACGEDPHPAYDIFVDDELSETSKNPVQNKVITEALNGKVDKSTEKTVFDQAYIKTATGDNSRRDISIEQLPLTLVERDIQGHVMTSKADSKGQAVAYEQLEQRVPAGGKEGQNLTKKSDKDYDVYWADPDDINSIEHITLNGEEVHVENKTAKITVDKATVGLDNVDNTADVNKPVSKLQQNALSRLNEAIAKNPEKLYLTWKGYNFPYSNDTRFIMPAGSYIDWGDGVIDAFTTIQQSDSTDTQVSFGVLNKPDNVSKLNHGINDVDYTRKENVTCVILNNENDVITLKSVHDITSFDYVDITLQVCDESDSENEYSIYSGDIEFNQTIDGKTPRGSHWETIRLSIDQLRQGGSYITDETITSAWKACQQFKTYYEQDNALFLNFGTHFKGQEVWVYIADIRWGIVVPSAVRKVATENTSTVATHMYTGDDFILTHLISIYGLSQIPEDGFIHASYLIDIRFPTDTIDINYRAFCLCQKLTRIELPHTRNIGKAAFLNSNFIKYVRLGQWVKSIGDSAFSGCDQIEKFYIDADTPPTLGKNAFYYTSDQLKIIVPKSSIDAYKSTAGWSEYADKIVYEVDSSDLDKAITDLDVDNIAYKNKANTFTQTQTVGDVEVTTASVNIDDGSLTRVHIGKDAIGISGSNFIPDANGFGTFLTLDSIVLANNNVASATIKFKASFSDSGSPIKPTIYLPQYNGTILEVDELNRLRTPNKGFQLFNGDIITWGSVRDQFEQGFGTSITDQGIYFPANQDTTGYGSIYLHSAKGYSSTGVLSAEQLLQPKSGTLALIEDLTAKLDKPTVADSNYKIVTYNGTNSGTLDYSNAPNASSIMQRDADGRAQVVSGVSGNDIVNYSQLDTKYDKTGGTIGGNVIITGDLTVNGTQHINNTENLNVENAMIYSNAKGATLATNGGIGIKKNATDVYGIVYDPTSDSVKLGLGKSDANGVFTFNANEGQPVAIRDDSSKFNANHFIKWNEEQKKLVDSGYLAEDFVDVVTQQSIGGIKTFTDEVHFGTTHFSKDLNVDNAIIKIFDNQKDLVTQYKSDSITIDNGTGSSAVQYVLTLPKETGTLLLNKFKYSTFGSSNDGDSWNLIDGTKNLEIKYQDVNSHSSIFLEKDYIELSDINGTGSAKISLASNVITIDTVDSSDKHKIIRVNPDKVSIGNNTDTPLVEIDSLSAKFNNRPQVRDNGNYVDVALKSDLDNYVPTQSESVDKYYAQITNENGIISARIFQNGGEDVQNLTIDKNGVKVLGKNIATTDSLATKVNKLAESLRNQAYVRDNDGNDTGLAYTYTDEGNTLAVRNASGQLQVSTPSQDNDAANKKFVEDEIAVEVETSLMGA